MVFDWEKTPTPIYANVALASPYDDIFGVLFAEVRPETSEKRHRNGDTSIEAHIVANIRVPPSAMGEVANSFVGAWNDYVDSLSEQEQKRHQRFERVPGAKRA